jgi:heme oxygenase (biliverdin-producing, ferredoxin)
MALAPLLERAAVRLPYDLEQRLELEPLSTVLKQVTWGAHEEVESGPLEKALVDGALPVDAYADLLAQSLPVYETIERLGPTFAGDPVAGPFVRPEVYRAAAIERDLQHYWGPSWRERQDLLPETQLYVGRIADVAASDPIRWIAHSYTRYLADLSGGLTIDQAIRRAFRLEGNDGRWLYTFELGGASPVKWKNAYRQLLNILDVPLDDKVCLIEEALVAYECNIALNDALAARHHVPGGS